MKRLLFSACGRILSIPFAQGFAMSRKSPRDSASAHAFAISRRAFVRGVLMGVPAALAVSPGLAFAQSLERKTLTLFNTHTAEQLTVDFVRDGQWCQQSLAALTRVLRDHRTGLEHPIDCGLFDQLHDLAVLADREARYEVISGYRSPATNEALHERSAGVARHSLHVEGRAIDVRLMGYPTDRLRDLALAAQRGGVGYYRASDFVHIDTGRVRAWTG
jgi:uncharacterized protein YcbK (DUF882 family)